MSSKGCCADQPGGEQVQGQERLAAAREGLPAPAAGPRCCLALQHASLSGGSECHCIRAGAPEHAPGPPTGNAPTCSCCNIKVNFGAGHLDSTCVPGLVRGIESRPPLWSDWQAQHAFGACIFLRRMVKGAHMYELERYPAEFVLCLMDV